MIYVNDIKFNNVGSKIIMFADDSVLVRSELDPVTAVHNLEHDLGVVSNYFSNLKLKLNRSKTKILNFDVKLKKSDLRCFPTLMSDGVEIEAVKSFCYLGIWVDCYLRLNVHLNHCIKKAHHKIYMLSKLRVYMDNASALKLFKSMVLPYIEYGNSFLLGSDKVGRIKLQRVQNKGLKVALRKDSRYSTDILHKEANLATWEVRARMALTKLMFKYKGHEEFIVTNVSDGLTRLQLGTVFKIVVPKTNNYRNSVAYLSRIEWNCLPSYIRCIDTYTKFKKEIKLLFNHRYFSSILEG